MADDAGGKRGAGEPATGVAGRMLSVDALRGFDMFWIIGADALFQALNKLAGGNRLIQGIANQLDHVAWEGFRFYDLIFPLFVFIVGVSITFSLPRRIAQVGRAAAAWQVVRRAAILWLLGILVYDGMAKGYEQVRLLGVLQRIALCYLCAGLAFIFLKPRALVALCGAILAGYWAMMMFIPVPGVGAGNFEEGKNLANWVDKEYLPLRKWDGDHDPEGLLSTLPAIASALLGIFAGLHLQSRRFDERKKVAVLMAAGVALVASGFLWGLQFPIIKKLWTSSYVLVAGGFSALLLGVFYYVIDVRKSQRWAMPFVWIGMNAITIYLAVDLVGVGNLAQRLAGGEIKGWFDGLRPGLGDFVLACVALALCLAFVRFLYRRKIFLKV